MRMMALLLVVAGCSSSPQAAGGEEFVQLFNGRDLSGWVNVNGGPETWSVRGEEIVTSGHPSGILRSPKMYENFVLELDWMHLKEGGNSGLFVHSGALPIRGNCFTKAFECQIMLGDDPKGMYSRHGDMFSIQGAKFLPDRPHPQGWERCLPSEKRVKGAGEWNHYRVTSKDGSIKLEANGAEVSGGTKCVPRKGYICLESEGAECHFKNVRIRELPGSGATAEETAETDQGYATLYGGDLRGWKTSEEGHWTARDWRLGCDGKGKELLSEREVGDFALIVDWTTPKAGSVELRVRGKAIVLEATSKAGQWNRAQVTVKGATYTLAVNDTKMTDQGSLAGTAPRGALALYSPDATTFANVYFKELK